MLVSLCCQRVTNGLLPDLQTRDTLNVLGLAYPRTARRETVCINSVITEWNMAEAPRIFHNYGVLTHASLLKTVNKSVVSDSTHGKGGLVCASAKSMHCLFPAVSCPGGRKWKCLVIVGYQDVVTSCMLFWRVFCLCDVRLCFLSLDLILYALIANLAE
jgi:hypothetical protein